MAISGYGNYTPSNRVPTPTTGSVSGTPTVNTTPSVTNQPAMTAGASTTPSVTNNVPTVKTHVYTTNAPKTGNATTSGVVNTPTTPAATSGVSGTPRVSTTPAATSRVVNTPTTPAASPNPFKSTQNDRGSNCVMFTSSVPTIATDTTTAKKDSSAKAKKEDDSENNGLLVYDKQVIGDDGRAYYIKAGKIYMDAKCTKTTDTAEVPSNVQEAADLWPDPVSVTVTGIAATPTPSLTLDPTITPTVNPGEVVSVMSEHGDSVYRWGDKCYYDKECTDYFGPWNEEKQWAECEPTESHKPNNNPSLNQNSSININSGSSSMGISSANSTQDIIYAGNENYGQLPTVYVTANGNTNDISVSFGMPVGQWNSYVENSVYNASNNNNDDITVDKNQQYEEDYSDLNSLDFWDAASVFCEFWEKYIVPLYDTIDDATEKALTKLYTKAFTKEIAIASIGLPLLQMKRAENDEEFIYGVEQLISGLISLAGPYGLATSFLLDLNSNFQRYLRSKFTPEEYNNYLTSVAYGIKY